LRKTTQQLLEKGNLPKGLFLAPPFLKVEKGGKRLKKGLKNSLPYTNIIFYIVYVNSNTNATKATFYTTVK
jgi:hypothetical protein